MRKIYSLIVLMLTIFSANVFADTESPGNSGKANEALTGNSYSIAGTYVAGAGGVKIGSMQTKGVKLRSNQTSNTLVISVKPGYKINNVRIYGCTNDNTKTVEVSKISADGNDVSTTSKVLPGKSATASADFELNGVNATDNITLHFGAGAGTQIVLDFSFDYIQESVVTAKVTGLSIAGQEISAENLAILKSTKELTLDGAAYNGLPTIVPTIKNGNTTVSCAVENNDVKYSFTINTNETYVVTLKNVAKTYPEGHTVIAYKEGETDATGQNTSVLSLNGITFTMVNSEKAFQYGTGSVQLGDVVYQPIKLSTGSAVNVTFPTGLVAKKVTIYGWSQSNNGKLYSMSESESSEKTIDVSSSIFYAGNNSYDKYPSVYEFTLDEWSSAYFNAGGSPSQPYVVMDFELDTASGIKNVNAAASEGKMYNLAGQQVSSNAKGIIIMNGKKYMK